MSQLEGTNGISDANFSGLSANDAGDVNGDGFDDLIVRDFAADKDFVVFSNAGNFADRLDPASLKGTNGFVIVGSFPKEFFYYAISSAGDINGDGFDDVIIGASLH